MIELKLIKMRKLFTTGRRDQLNQAQLKIEFGVQPKWYLQNLQNIVFDIKKMGHFENDYMTMFSIVLEQTCFQNKSKFITEDQFVKHMNITIK